MAEIHPDVSEHQTVLDESYDRNFIMFRIANEYARIDYNADTNLSVALKLRSKSFAPIRNFGGYVIPCISAASDIESAVDDLDFPTDAVIMIDTESWGGAVSGNHSDELNQMAEHFRTRQGGRSDLVWGYGNQGDLDGIWPQRVGWLQFIVAGYTDESDMNFAPYNAIGWQYTNGTENYTSLPSETAPFGTCDHNRIDDQFEYPSPAGAEGSDELSAQEVQQITDNGDVNTRLLMFGDQDDAGKPLPPGTNTHPNNLNRLRGQMSDLHDLLVLMMYGDTDGNGQPLPPGQNTHPWNLKMMSDRLADLAQRVEQLESHQL
jgi:hypothetical protein